MAKFSSLSSGTSLTGTSGTWAAGLVTGNIRQWSLNVMSPLIDATSKADGGWQTSVYGNKVGDFSIEMAADDTTVLAVTAGSADPVITLILFDGGTDRSASFSAKFSGMNYTGIVFSGEGALPVITFTGKSQGAITFA